MDKAKIVIIFWNGFCYQAEKVENEREIVSFLRNLPTSFIDSVVIYDIKEVLNKKRYKQLLTREEEFTTILP